MRRSLTGVRSERQEVQQAVLNVERGVSQTLAGLTGYLTEQQNRSAAEVRTLNETARQSLAETREVMNRQLLELQGLVDALREDHRDECIGERSARRQARVQVLRDPHERGRQP